MNRKSFIYRNVYLINNKLHFTAPCEAGKERNDNKICENCGVGMFNTDGLSCVVCPLNKTSDRGSSSEDDCYYRE